MIEAFLERWYKRICSDFLERLFNMAELNQEQKLLAEKKQQEKQGTMVPFNSTVIDVGIPVREHYPNLKDSSGKTIKDERGYAKKADKSDGFAVTLAVFGKHQFVQLVFAKQVSLVPGRAYKASGFGYDVGEDFYVKQEPRLQNY